MTAFLAAAEQAGLDALEHDLSPAELLQRIQEAFVAATPRRRRRIWRRAGAAWWTEGGPRVAARLESGNGLAGEAAALLPSSTMAGLQQMPPPERLVARSGSFVMSDNGIGQDTARFGSFRSRAATHAGTANRLNEDAYVNRPDLGLWAVADGAGGHESGEVASAEVASLLQSIDAGLSASRDAGRGADAPRGGACAVARRGFAAWRRRDGGDDRGGAAGARRPFRLPVGGRFARLSAARPRAHQDHARPQPGAGHGRKRHHQRGRGRPSSAGQRHHARRRRRQRPARAGEAHRPAAGRRPAAAVQRRLVQDAVRGTAGRAAVRRRRHRRRASGHGRARWLR